MPMVLTWSGLFMLYHASADEKRVPATGAFPLPEARYVYFFAR
jgi:hypothetical protein